MSKSAMDNSSQSKPSDNSIPKVYNSVISSTAKNLDKSIILRKVGDDQQRNKSSLNNEIAVYSHRSQSSHQYHDQLQNSYHGQMYKLGPQIRNSPYENVQQTTNQSIVQTNLKHRREERNQLIQAGINNMSFVGINDYTSKYYSLLKQNFQVKSAAVSPMKGQKDPFEKVNHNQSFNNMNYNSTVNATDRFKQEKQHEEDQKQLKLKEFIRKKQQIEIQEDEDKFALKYFFKKNPTLESKSGPEVSSEQDPLQEARKFNIQSLMADQKSLNLNLRDFRDQKIFEMQSIIDDVLRKVSDSFISRKMITKSYFKSVESKTKDAEYYQSWDYQQICTKLACDLWEEVIANKLSHFKDYVRWDIFEENLIILMLEKMNFSHEILNKVNWKVFFRLIMDECTQKIPDNKEIPIPASNSTSKLSYKGLHIKKSKFVQFVARDKIFLSLQQAVGEEEMVMDEQFKPFKESNLIQGGSSLFRYCDGSWYKGQRQNRRREGKGKLQLITGEFYEGEFVRGLRQGFGKMRYHIDQQNGKEMYTDYMGTFKFDLKVGTTTVEFYDGSRFHGQFKDNLQHYGTYYWPAENPLYPNLSQKEYTGYWIGPLMQGQGVLSDKDQVQTGVFKDSKLNGQGVKQDVDSKFVLKGVFAAGVLSGQLCEIKNEEGIYFGEIKDGLLHGKGVMNYNTGDSYEGEWLNGKFHGKGRYIDSKDNSYQGSWKQGKKNGYGLETRFNKDKQPEYIYEGGFFDDIRQGYGSLKQTYGDQYIEYIGAWEGDDYHGKGKLLVFDSQDKKILYEDFDGDFKQGLKHGLGRLLKLRPDQEQESAEKEYDEFIGDFKYDNPIPGENSISKVIKISN